ncbi:MAG: YraN family protein [Pseudomonadota bacterium]
MAFHAGSAAEDCVARHYADAGLCIAERRWRGTCGEIDLVAEEGDGFVFVEVKRARSFAEAAERVTSRQMQRIMNTALEYIARRPSGLDTPMRFDVALVDGMGRVEVVENAFGA